MEHACVPEVAELVRSASAGDSDAWEGLVRRFSGLVWSIARAQGLNATDAADVTQTTWLRLLESLGRLRDPERVGPWLATTARNESRRILRRAGRQLPVGDDAELEPEAAPVEGPEAQLLASERSLLLWRAFTQLPNRCQRLLRVLMTDPAPSYEEASTALDMPVGSIGPTRARCLRALRKLMDL
jgi:RNA polymerase sigma factor (sigma-70 family)